VSAIDAMLHTGELRFAKELRESATLESELKDFRRHVSEAGRYKYAAREGKHDDLVLAVAIALWRAVKCKARFDGPSKKPRVLYGYEHAKRHLRHG
jgi:ribosomal protein L37AE/L43A